MSMIIPGVQVSVVKEVVPPQLSPSGVLGITGLVEKAPAGGVGRAGSWNRFVELFGAGSALSMPEARQALQNGVFEVVVSAIPADKAATATVSLDNGLSLSARAPGSWANGVSVAVSQRTRGGEVIGVDLHITRTDGSEESYRNVGITPGRSNFLLDVLTQGSATLSGAVAVTSMEKTTFTATTRPTLQLAQAGSWSVTAAKSEDSNVSALEIVAANGAWTATVYRTGADDTVLTGSGLSALCAAFAKAGGLVISATGWPSAGGVAAGGVDAGRDDYAAALGKLREVSEVDMVIAAVQDDSNSDDVAAIYSDVIAHCDSLSAEGMGRVGFGQAPSGATAQEAAQLAVPLVSDRFVLIAPHGVLGAVAGMIGGLDYFRSPTFKSIAGVGSLSANLATEDQQVLLTNGVVPIAAKTGRGFVVVRGLTTDKDQISVRRVADRAVRGVRLIGERFIGKLNNADGRASLRSKISEFLLQMEKDGAIVPSTDGSDPAFKIDVYSSQADFALGIVRVDIAVRPVRAIDYIIATLFVQV